jgi:hypothetical protein
VETLLLSRDKEMRRLSKYLYEQDTLNAEEMDRIIKGKGLDKEKESNKVRTWDTGKYGKPTISLA